MNSATQRSPVPMTRRTVKRLEFGCAVRDAWMLCRPLMRSPDCGYSSTASSRYMSCSLSKSFTSDAAQWRLSASRISVSFIRLLPLVGASVKPGIGFVAHAAASDRCQTLRLPPRRVFLVRMPDCQITGSNGLVRGREASNEKLLCRHFIQHGAGGSQVRGCEAFGEPVVDRLKHHSRVSITVLIQ